MLPTRHSGKQLDAGFEEFVAARSAALLRTAFLLVGDRGHAEDLVQSALLRAALRWRRARDHPEAYVRQILVNLARDRWRWNRRRVTERPLTDLVPLPDQRDHANAVVDQAAVQRALAALPARQREVVVLRFFADLSVADTAAAMRTSEGTVKSQTSRALAQLRALLGDHADDLAEADRAR
ncbi:SigE family RNA polymerase sigma factor [Umezawaea beigongshangensis]|uniref:SigE family RNA polymerase sigma factor n=1 Tax=Umezawaea beigongshangensis TaxID=2780383 RepID=UPI0018F1765B|nr:SigE family RNA polymerase sigma factor [Umezawaea beigongshangensis]